MVTTGSLAVRLGERSATSGEAASEPLAKSALIYRAGWTLTFLILLKSNIL